MNNFYAVITDTSGNDWTATGDLKLIPQWINDQDIGGCLAMEVRAEGPLETLWPLLQTLGYSIVAYNQYGSPCWWGRIDEAVVVTKAAQVGLSLKNMRNYVAVAYTVTANGASQSRQTDWSGNSESIARYGQREKLLSLSDTSDAQAIAYRNAKLNSMSKPAAIRRIQPSQSVYATLRCVGWYTTLEDRYYAQASGLEYNDGGNNGEQALGQGMTSTSIGFAKNGKISDVIGGRFKYLLSKTGKITFSGSASNNGSYIVKGTDNRDLYTLVSNKIWFDVSDDMMDDDGHMGFIQVDDFIYTTGNSKPENTGYFRIMEAGADHCVLWPRQMSLERSYPTTSITRGNFVETTVKLVQEFPGNSVTVTVDGSMILQYFALANNISWTVNQVVLRMRKVGNPVDSAKVELVSDAGSFSFTVLESATVAGASIGTRLSDVTFQFANTTSIAYGTNYALRLSRTGANSMSDFYVVEVDEDASYPRGAMYLWNGSAWVSRYVNEPPNYGTAKLNFRILGAWESTAQIQQMVASSNFLTGVDIVNASGIYSNQYRDGKTYASVEIAKLLNSGTSNGRRLLARVTQDRILRIYEQEAEPSDIKWMVGDNQLIDGTGNMPEDGKLVAGDWAWLAGIPPTVADLTGISPFPVGKSECNCETGETKVTPTEEFSVWDL